MKKFITFTILIFTSVLLFSSNQVKASAVPSFKWDETQLVSIETIKNHDGSYLVSKIYDSHKNEGIMRAASNYYSKSSSKVVTYYSAVNTVLWTYTLDAEFIVNHGVYTMCMNSFYSKNIYGSGWSFSDGEASYVGNTAYGKGKFTYKILFIPAKTLILDLSISCDIYGNIIENN